MAVDPSPQPSAPPEPSSVERRAGESASWSLADGALASSAAPPAIGTIVAGKYQLAEPLGSGGTGMVFRAQHLGLAQSVAIKLIHPALVSNETSLRRFRREARAVFNLHHPNIVRVLDFGEDPLPHIVMEYVPGFSLGGFLAGLGEPPRLSLVADVGRQILSALEAAHHHQIVHRDLKPDNVLLLTDAGGSFTEVNVTEVKVTDFGLAHFDDTEDAGPTLTREGLIAGTPAYMSPEQCRSLAVGPSSDLYAFGCVLTELLQLAPPFAHAPSALLLSQHMFMPPPPLARPAASEPIHPALEALRLSLLAKHPHQRPPTAASVRERLAEALQQTPPSRRPRSERGNLGPGSSPPATGERQVVRLSVVSVPSRSLAGIDATGNAAAADDPSCASGLGPELETGLSMQGIELAPEGQGQILLLVDARDVAEVCAGLEQLLARGRGRPVIVVTSHGAARDVLQLVEAGAADILRPPLAADGLAASVLRIARRESLLPKK